MKLSCGSRMSVAAVRTMRQMKRYSSTRKAIFSASKTVWYDVLPTIIRAPS